MNPPELLDAIVLSTVASIVIVAVAVLARPPAYAVSGTVGLLLGCLLQPSETLSPFITDLVSWSPWRGYPLVGLAFALGLAAMVDGFLSSSVPGASRIRLLIRRAMQPQRWGTAAEIGERAGMDPGIIRLLGHGIEAEPLTVEQVLSRVRIAASVLSGSFLGLFAVVESFRQAVLETLTPGHLLANVVATLLAVFFIEPLQHELTRRLGAGDHASPTTPTRRGSAMVTVPLAVFGVMVLLQAIHNAVEKELSALLLVQWLTIFELCVLPLLVTTYYFGAAFFRTELGSYRWDRALESSIVAGTVVLLPFALPSVVDVVFPTGVRDALASALSTPRQGTLGAMFVVLLLAYLATLAAIAMAVIASAASYGVYALALGLAMLDAPPSTARSRAVVAVLGGGIVAQALLSGAVWWFGLEIESVHLLHVMLALGWAAGLWLSRFDEGLTAGPVEHAH